MTDNLYVTFKEARKLLLENVEPNKRTRIFVRESLGCILSEDIYSPINLPPFTSSAVDGYAINTDWISELPAKLEILGEISAGSSKKLRIKNGETIKVFTGSPLPDGADAVIEIKKNLQYVPELTWMLFLKILDEKEQIEEEEAKALGIPFIPSLEYPYRWRDWAAPNGKKRIELQQGTLGAFMSFVNNELIPYLRNLKNRPGATPRQKVISEVFSATERTYIDTERNLLDVLDKINELSIENVDETHMFTLSQVYEGLLLKMGEKNNDGGQFFTPREIIRVMVKVIDPKIGETVYDPCCGTGGFLVQAYLHMKEKAKTASDIEILKTQTFYGREKDNLVYPIALANLVIHGIDEPHIWHGNTLTGQEFYGGLFTDAPAQYDVILTNPPFGGKESQDAQTRFAYKTSSTQVLFLQHVIDSLKPGGRCGIVVDEGVLFRTNEKAFVQTKRKLLEECNVWCIVSLPPKVFVNAGAASKTNLLFFTKGEPTTEIWYYDLSDINVTKKQPLTFQHFEEFFKLLPERGISERSWRVRVEEIRAKNYDLKAVNPNRKEKEDTRSPEEIISIIQFYADEIRKSIEALKGK